jgi:hypothetical protein
MRFGGRVISARAVFILLLPAFLLSACEKQNNSKQNNPQPAHEQLAGGGHQRLRAICADDIQKYCATADRKRRCLRDNMDKLSEACKTALAERRGRKARANNGSDDE